MVYFLSLENFFEKFKKNYEKFRMVEEDWSYINCCIKF